MLLAFVYICHSSAYALIFFHCTHSSQLKVNAFSSIHLGVAPNSPHSAATLDTLQNTKNLNEASSSLYRLPTTAAHFMHCSHPANNAHAAAKDFRIFFHTNISLFCFAIFARIHSDQKPLVVSVWQCILYARLFHCSSHSNALAGWPTGWLSGWW